MLKIFWRSPEPPGEDQFEADRHLGFKAMRYAFDRIEKEL